MESGGCMGDIQAKSECTSWPLYSRVQSLKLQSADSGGCICNMQSPEGRGPGQPEGCIFLAYHCTTTRAWIHTTQGRLPQCSCPQIWLATKNMLSTCDCGKHFSMEHALSCARDSFPSITHNEIRDITTTLHFSCV